MSKTAPNGTTRIELWLPETKADYGNQVADKLKTRRKLLFEKVILDYLEQCMKKIPYVVQQRLNIPDLEPKKAVPLKKQATARKEKILKSAKALVKKNPYNKKPIAKKKVSRKKS